MRTWLINQMYIEIYFHFVEESRRKFENLNMILDCNHLYTHILLLLVKMYIFFSPLLAILLKALIKSSTTDIRKKQQEKLQTYTGF